jgi:NAD(P)-dependent dehydrogenase (short-subunit alcohol dehydrogenase family)
MSKVWLVSGGAGGLGPALSEAVLARGDRLMVVAPRADPIADLVPHQDERARALVLDVTDPDAADFAVAQTVSAFGRLDVVVNHAGYATFGPVDETPLEELELQIATGLWAPIHVTRAALPVMRAQGEGHIVQVTIVDGRRARPSLGAYQTAAWGLAGYSEALAVAVAPLGIRVTIVEPGRLEMAWPAIAAAARVGVSHDAPADPLGALVRGDAPVRDPAKAARTLLRVVAEKRPPLRLSLGGDPVGLAELGACSIRCEQYGR